MATKKNPDDVPAVPVPPAAPEASAPESSAPEASAPETPVAAEPAAPAPGIPTPPPAPYGAPEAPAAERPDPYAAPPAYSAPPSGYAAPPAAPAGPYGTPPPYGTTPPAYGAQQPYGAGAYYPPAPPQGMSLASMITGIGSIVFTFAGFGFLPGIAAVILGQIAKKSQPHARGFWLTGLITGWIAIGLGLLTGLAILAAIFIPIFLALQADAYNY